MNHERHSSPIQCRQAPVQSAVIASPAFFFTLARPPTHHIVSNDAGTRVAIGSCYHHNLDSSRLPASASRKSSRPFFLFTPVRPPAPRTGCTDPALTSFHAYKLSHSATHTHSRKLKLPQTSAALALNLRTLAVPCASQLGRTSARKKTATLFFTFSRRCSMLLHKLNRRAKARVHLIVS